MGDLSGKVAIITGAASGIGLAGATATITDNLFDANSSTEVSATTAGAIWVFRDGPDPETAAHSTATTILANSASTASPA